MAVRATRASRLDRAPSCNVLSEEDVSSVLQSHQIGRTSSTKQPSLFSFLLSFFFNVFPFASLSLMFFSDANRSIALSQSLHCFSQTITLRLFLSVDRPRTRQLFNHFRLTDSHDVISNSCTYLLAFDCNIDAASRSNLTSTSEIEASFWVEAVTQSRLEIKRMELNLARTIPPCASLIQGYI